MMKETQKILIVDDEEDVLLVLEKGLMSAGYSVISADNGSDAIKLARAERPDLIILDVVMPEMDGSEVAASLRQDPSTNDIPVIFLTCILTKQEEARMGHLIAKNIFVAKPYKIEELLAQVEKLLWKKGDSGC